MWAAHDGRAMPLYPVPAAPLTGASTFVRRRRDLRTLARLMRYRRLHALFQPLADLHSGGVYGHEALIRGPAGTLLHTPDALLALARSAGVLPLFELFCLQTVLADWHRVQGCGRLFLNLSADALVTALRRHGAVALLAHLRRLQIDPGTLVVELTEHERASDPAALQDAVRQLRAHGVALALDDFGDGRSSLRLWSQLRPEFVKIDKYFTRALQGTDAPENLRVVQAVIAIAEAFGTQLVAEGIETGADLRVLRELRIPYGQGYLLGRPAPMPRQQVAQAARTVLGEASALVVLRQQLPARPGVLRGFPRIDAPTAQPDTTHDALAALFQQHGALHAIALVENDRPVALVNRQQFMNRYATLYFREVHGKKPCIGCADPAPRIVDIEDDIDALVAILTSHDQRYLSDGFIMTERGRYAGLGTGEQLVRTVTEARIEAARHANPLTFLPGNIPINLQIDRLLNGDVSFVACHADLNDFKPFNDHYGYWRGDEMIRLVARVSLAHADPQHDFVGHVGGDDFVLLFQSPDWHLRCERIVDEVAEHALALFDPTARASGGIHGEDRDGRPRFYPCTTLSIGVVPVRGGQFRRADEVASQAALAKHDAKMARQRILVRQPDAPRTAAPHGESRRHGLTTH